MGVLNCVVCLAGNDVTMDDVNCARYVSAFQEAINSIMARDRDRGMCVVVFFHCSFDQEVVNGIN